MRRLSAILAVAALVSARPAAHAQHADRNWLAHCREDAEDSDRPQYCEQRALGAHATGGTISIDGGENGGARVAGWDRDSIDIITRQKQRLRAQLNRGCRALDFYAGFYMQGTKDGQLCEDRDQIHARTGAKCEIEKFRLLVAVPRDDD